MLWKTHWHEYVKAQRFAYVKSNEGAGLRLFDQVDRFHPSAVHTHLDCCRQCRLKVTLPVVSVQKPKRLSLSPCSHVWDTQTPIQNCEWWIMIHSILTSILCTDLECSRHSHIAQIFQLWRTTDEETPQGRSRSCLQGTPCVAGNCMLTCHTHKHIEKYQNCQWHNRTQHLSYNFRLLWDTNVCLIFYIDPLADVVMLDLGQPHF